MPVKRKVRAKSSKDSTPSPDDKRTRKEFDSVSSQTDDEVIEALNMAEDLGKKIEHVLLKLGKLHVIESRLQEMNSTLANIEQTVSRLDEEDKILKVKTNKTQEVVKVLKENLEFNEDDISDLKRDRFYIWKLIPEEKTLNFLAYQKNRTLQMARKECKMAHSFQQKTPKKLFTTF